MACSGQPVSLDAAAASKIRKGSPLPASFKAEEPEKEPVFSSEENWPGLTTLQAFTKPLSHAGSLISRHSSDDGRQLDSFALTLSWTSLLQARAVILVRTLSLVNGNSKVRLSVVEALVNILNSGTSPYLGERYELRQLANILAGVCITPYQPTRTHDLHPVTYNVARLPQQPRLLSNQGSLTWVGLPC